MLLFSFVGVLLFRLEDCKLLVLLFQLPPRRPREELRFPRPRAPAAYIRRNTAARKRQLCAWAVCAAHARTHAAFLLQAVLKEAFSPAV